MGNFKVCLLGWYLPWSCFPPLHPEDRTTLKEELPSYSAFPLLPTVQFHRVQVACRHVDRPGRHNRSHPSSRDAHNKPQRSLESAWPNSGGRAVGSIYFGPLLVWRRGSIVRALLA